MIGSHLYNSPPMTDKASELLALAERCEKASGPDRELDALIRRVVFADFVLCGDSGSACAACMMGLDATQFPECGAPLGMVDERASHPSRWQDDDRLPAYTASLDAAMTLVPEGWDWSVSSYGEDGASAEVWEHGWRDDTRINSFLAKAPALCLVVADLRAHALNKEESRG